MTDGSEKSDNYKTEVHNGVNGQRSKIVVEVP